MTDHTQMKEPSLWVPIDNPVDIACIGKLIEELGELQSALARCLIQGIDGTEPTTGKRNLTWLREEIADVRALVYLAERRIGMEPFDARMRVKIEHKQKWFDMLKTALGVT